MADTAMALAVISAFLLTFGGVRMAIGREQRTKGVLMIVAAAVLLANVVIWTV